jgi:hypothetical protein
MPLPSDHERRNKNGIPKMMIFVVCLEVAAASAQEYGTFISPGINLAYIRGEHGGFVLGFEISATTWPSEGFYWGLAAKYDIWGNGHKFHLAAEARIHTVLSFSIGPAWSTIDEDRYVGYTGTLFTGLVLMPYYSYTSCSNDINLIEYGTYIKAPIQVGGPHANFRLGG